MSARQATALRVYHNDVDAGRIDPLPAWALALAEWTASRETMTGRKYVKFFDAWEEAGHIAARLGIELLETQVRKMLKSEAFRKYRNLCVNDLVAAARHKFMLQAGKAVDLHYDAMEWAREQKAVAHVAGLTEPVFKRLMPVHEHTPQQTNIQINLTAQQLDAVRTDTEPHLEIEAVSDDTD